MTFVECRQVWQEFQLWPNGTLMLTKYGMCVKPTGPVTDGVQVGKLVLKYISCYNVFNAEREQTDIMDYGLFNFY